MNRAIHIIGGDDRELYLSKLLLVQGFEVTLWGFDKIGFNKFNLGIIDKRIKDKPNSAFVFPMSGTKETGEVTAKYSSIPIKIGEEFFKVIPKESILIIGFARQWFQSMCLQYGVLLIEVGNDDELAIYNSIPTAEGSIKLAMENSEITIHNSKSLVIGFGRCGLTLARMLKGIDSKVYVYARNEASLARAYEMGFIPVVNSDLVKLLGQMDFIFNTAPAMVLPKELLNLCRNCEVIIDISTAPGGVDFSYAKQIGIKALLAPGLPGIVAPKTAAEILAKIYPKYLGRR